jgi:hypothetical protein
MPRNTFQGLKRLALVVLVVVGAACAVVVGSTCVHRVGQRIDLPDPNEVEQVTGTVYPKLTSGPLLENVALTAEDYDHLRKYISDFHVTDEKLREFDKLGIIRLKLKNGVEFTITYYHAGKGAVLFTLNDRSQAYVAVDKETDISRVKDVAITISNYIREKAEEK